MIDEYPLSLFSEPDDDCDHREYKRFANEIIENGRLQKRVSEPLKFSENTHGENSNVGRIAYFV